MTVKKDLEKALAAAESAKGTYATFAASTDDQTAKQSFQQMAQDMDQHISAIRTRLNATAENQLSSVTTAAGSVTSAVESNQQY
jgi:L-lactate utilization protein LutC